MACWSEKQLTEDEFLAALYSEDMWEEVDGGAADAVKDGSDFLALVRGQRPHVVLLQEGYHRLQAAALDRQLPPELRAAAQPGFTGYPPPAQLYWQPSANLLHPLQLLSRELTGCAAACRPTQPMSSPLAHLEQVPVAVAERCKLLEVHYLLKELHQHPPPVQAQHDGDAQQPQQPEQVQQVQAQLQQLLPEHQQVWGAAGDGIVAQQPPLCRRLSIRVVLQRMPAAPLTDEQDDAAAEGGSWQQSGLQGCGQTQQVAYMCALEYPVHTLRSSDYIISAQLFDRGLSNWQALQKGDAFTMPWDGTPWRGFALCYRQRKPGDPFAGSPWWSIAVEWEGHSMDRKKDPDDWLYGNPWEMTREHNTGPPQLPDLQTALATANKAGHPVLAAPWTTIGRAVAEQAVRRAPAKRKRQGQHHHDDDFVYDDSLDEEAAAAAGHVADAWDPTTDFYYDDDPEEYELDVDHDLLQPRRKSGRRHGSTGRHRRTSSRRGSPSPSFDGAGGCSGRAHKAAAATAPGELTHNYGRELLASTDVCVVCGSKEGSLMSGHTGRGSACARQYHSGCLLLLNAAGIRTVMLGKSGAQQQRKHTCARSSSSSVDAVGPAAASAQAQQLCDGLLGLLLQQSQQADCQLSAPVLAALAAAQEAAVRVASGELVLICPSHGCHGCKLNGKLEFMVWCCCCWIRVYHHRQCVPMGAEHVQLEGRDFIRCPHCRAAGVPVPGTVAAAAAAAAADGLQPTAAGVISGGVSAPDAAAAAAAADVAGRPVAAGVSDCSLAGSDGPMVTPAAQGTGSGAAAGDQQAAESEITLRLGLTAAAADVMDIDQQRTGVMHQSDKQQPLQQQQPESSDDTLQDPLLPVSAAVSAVVAPAADQQHLAHAAAGQQQPEVVDLLDSELEGREEGPVVITIDSSDDAEHEHAEQRRARTPEQQQGVQQHLEQQLQQQQQHRYAVEPEQQEEQQRVAGSEGTRAGEEAAAEAVHMAAASSAAEDDVDMDVLAAVADIDAQLQALQQQAQHIAQMSLTSKPLQQQQQERGGSVTPSAAAAAPAEQGVAAALAAAAQAADQSQGPVMPAWLQLSLEDRERHSPSYALVPCVAANGASSSRGSNGCVDDTARVLAAAAAAARTLPPAAEPYGPASGDVDGLGFLLAAAGTADDAGERGYSGLPLTSPQSHLLIGCIEKAEKQYKPANVWGCAMIGVLQYPDDSSPYGLAIVLDYLPSLQQQQQGNWQGQQGIAQGQQEAGAATARQSIAGQAARVRPRVFLKCSKAVAQDGRLQPAMRARDDGERQGAREWQVLVNGAPYPQRQGRNGVALRVGDVITVQGLHFKLQLS